MKAVKSSFKNLSLKCFDCDSSLSQEENMNTRHTFLLVEFDGNFNFFETVLELFISQYKSL